MSNSRAIKPASMVFPRPLHSHSDAQVASRRLKKWR
jgi:hypothetical protein